MIRKILYIIILAFIALSASAQYSKPSDVPKPQIGSTQPWVVDPENILSQPMQQRINARLQALNDSTTVEAVVVMLPGIDGEDIDLYANELFDSWGIGRKNSNGILLLVARDDRRYVIRTGRGMEGTIPDIVAGRIGRRLLKPAFKARDYDRGIDAATAEIVRYASDPAAAAELRAAEDAADREEILDILLCCLLICAAATLLIGIYVILYATSKKDRYHKYLGMRPLARALPYLAIFMVGMPLLVYFPLKALMRRWRDGEHPCPNCKAPMIKQDEEHDNYFLTPAQDAEERFNSVDYDVWTCPNCNERVIYAFNNPDSNFHECSQCHARTAKLVGDTVVQRPTASREGVGMRQYKCLNCKHVDNRPYRIAKQVAPTIVVVPGGGHGSGGFGGGGFGGFGGGSTGGGGASGGW